MNSIPITITTLTPIHIGSGKELNSGYEYLNFAEEGKIALINEDKVFEIIGYDRAGIDQWVSIIDKKEDLKKWLKTRKPDLNAAAIALRSMNIADKAPAKQNTIKEQLHCTKDRQPTIPGSSLKGSIRSAVLTKLIKDDPRFVQRKKNLGFARRDGRFAFKDSQLNAHYFGKKDRPNRNGEIQLSANKDLMKLIRFFDAHFLETAVYKANIINKFRQGWGVKDRETSYWECISPNQTTTATIQLPQKWISEIRKKNYIQDNIELLQLANLFPLLNQHTLNLVQEELDYWDGESNPLAIGDCMEHLEEIEQALKNMPTNECIIRVGAGSGWNFMTGGWANKPENLDDNTWFELKAALRRRHYPDNVDFPKTRKLLDGGMPLGFVRIKIN